MLRLVAALSLSLTFIGCEMSPKGNRDEEDPTKYPAALCTPPTTIDMASDGPVTPSCDAAKGLSGALLYCSDYDFSMGKLPNWTVIDEATSSSMCFLLDQGVLALKAAKIPNPIKGLCRAELSLKNSPIMLSNPTLNSVTISIIQQVSMKVVSVGGGTNPKVDDFPKAQIFLYNQMKGVSSANPLISIVEQPNSANTQQVILRLEKTSFANSDPLDTLALQYKIALPPDSPQPESANWIIKSIAILKN